MYFFILLTVWNAVDGVVLYLPSLSLGDHADFRVVCSLLKTVPQQIHADIMGNDTFDFLPCLTENE